jgi:hypothetical protein|uniref:RING-type E3 ubiquitin transferase n=1 Tax=viral metagenome TaxID=1070528 RepID=A0A6C0AK59_9ZZZZ
MCFKKSYKIHPINFKTPKKDFKTNECIICLEKITYGRAVLNCGHHFHSTCVLKWFERNLTCPMCNQQFVWEWVGKKK